jgi:hypothetical protein
MYTNCIQIFNNFFDLLTWNWYNAIGGVLVEKIRRDKKNVGYNR